MLLCAAVHGATAPVLDQRDLSDVAAGHYGAGGGPDGGGVADIVWVNRLFGDNFAALYGANEVAARAVVDRAIADWERVITDFNYSDGSNTFNLTLRAELGPPGSAITTDVDADGKPRAGLVRLDDAAGSVGTWFFDPTPGSALVPDDSEYGVLLAPFNNDAGPANALDFYTAALHEIGHALGIAGADWDGTHDLAVIDFIDFNAWVVDPNNPGDGCAPNDPACGDPGNHVFPINFNGGAVDYTFTNAGSGAHPNTAPAHLYEGPAVGGLPFHPNELMNDGRTYNNNLDQRKLIGDTTASFLRDIYGFTVVMPSQINTFYANLDRTTNELRVSGDPLDADDVITIDVVGTDLRVAVNGTSERIPIAEIDVITIDSADGDDVINLYAIPSGVAVNVEVQDGAKVVNVGNGDVDNTVRGTITIDGHGDEYAVRVFDQDDTGADGYTVTNTAITKPGTLFGGVSYDGAAGTVVLTANDADNVINIESSYIPQAMTINGRGGDETFVVGGAAAVIGGAVNGDLTLDGGLFGADRVIFDDSSGTGLDLYALNGANYQQTGSKVLVMADVESVELRANDDANAIAMANSFSYDLTLEANGGDDLIDFGFGNLAAMGDATVRGGAGADALRLNDTAAFAPTTFTADQAGGSPFVELFNGFQTVTYDNVSALTIDAGPHADTVTSIALPATTSLRVNGNGGDDFLDVQGHPTQNALLLPRVTLTGGAGADTVEVNTDGQGGARAAFVGSETLERLALGTGGRLRLTEGGHVIDVSGSVAMPASGFELDLSDGMFVRRGNASFAYYRDRVAVGHDAGAWDGLGINSSTAAASPIGDGLGIARASELFNGAGGGVNGVNLAATDIVIRYALYGDANLDGTVNLADFNRVAANFGAAGTTWAQGNFNYDNVTNLSDFNLLAGNFGNGAPPDVRGGAGASLHELLDDLVGGRLTA